MSLRRNAVRLPRPVGREAAARLLAEGGEASGAPARLEFHVSYDCGNDCVFCSEAGRLKRFRGAHPSPAEVVAVLKSRRAAGFSHVTFTGGEPSLIRSLPQLLRIAKKLGYKTCVTTNGLAFAERRLAAGLLPALDEIILSVHGASGAEHDALTRTPGSFAVTRAALRNIDELAGRRIFLITNTLAVKGNLKGLPGILRWLGGFRAVKQFLVSYPAPEGRAAANYSGLAPKLDGLAAVVPGLVRIAARRRKILRFFGVPACALGRHAGCSNDLHWAPRLTVERGMKGGKVALREVYSGAPVRKRFYPAACGACGLIGACGGFFRPGPGRG
jgi:pyruvate-formate lyase-activating enzyme